MSEPLSLRLLSWNLNGLDTTRLDARMERACLELVLGMSLRDAMAGKRGPPLPEVIALQEVVRRSHLSKLSPHLTAAGFVLSPERPPREEGEYLMLAVRAPWRIESSRKMPFEYSLLGRDLLEADLVHEHGARVRVTTAHMESMRSGREARSAQAAELDRRLAASELPAVFLGDTNLRSDELPARFDARDAFELWARQRPTEAPRHLHTWWPEESTRGFRFDRIWVDARSDWRVRSFGTRRRAQVSDHAAVEARLTIDG